MTHTPGPWTNTELAAAIEPGFAYAIGHDPLGPSDVAWPIALAVTPDDARLIAAAPDLLAALKEMVSQGEWTVGCHFCTIEINSSGNPHHETDCPIQQAQAAIAKAKGD